ncbi:MAG: MFS transporter [Legionella sp.]|nr:MFS transporter [Legionella sp.]
MNKKASIVVVSLVFLEWLDFSLYLYLAKSIFANQFFPLSKYSLMLSFALFAVGFLARPLGGWFFGKSADRNGRKSPLIMSAALMGLATMGIALLPGFATIGVYATWGLLILRIAQGLALGGEMNNSAMFMVEHQSSNPLLAGSWVAAGGAAGMFFGGATAALLQTIEIDGLWRLVFFIVGLFSLWICSLRKKIDESPEFFPNQASVKQIFKEELPGLINIAILGTFVSVTVYICNVFWVSYAADSGVWSPKGCAWAGSISQLLSALIALPIASYTPPDKVRHLLLYSMASAFISAPVLFVFTATGSITGILCGLVFYIMANGLLCAALYYYLYLQLPAKYRCRGVSTAWAIAASIGAISLPLAQQAHLNHMVWLAPCWVSFIACAASLVLIKQIDKRPSSGFYTLTESL